MLSVIGFALLVAIMIWLLPLILAALSIAVCLVMALLCWIWEQLSSPFGKKS